MHILYCDLHFSTPQGSTGTRSYEMARRLVERGHSVTILCGQHEGCVTGLDGSFTHGRREGKVDAIHVIQYQHAFAWRIIAAVLTQTYDLLLTSGASVNAGIIGVLSRYVRRKPFVLEVGCVVAKSSATRRNPLVAFVVSALEWGFYRSANRLIALSPGMAEAIEERGVASSRIAMIPNGCDLALFAAPVSAWRPVEVRADDVMAVYAGAHEEVNGLHVLLDVAAELKRRGVDHVKIVCVGAGSLKSQLSARARHEHLDNLLFLEPVPKAKLAGLLASADLGMQLLTNIPAFHYGTSPSKFFDYIASGTPVLCNYPGWVAEMITLHQCGFAVAPDNIKAFADTLQYAANNRAELAAMGPRALQLGRTAFSRDQLAEKFCKWLEAAV